MGDLNFRTEGLEKDAAEQLISSERIDVLMEYDQVMIFYTVGGPIKIIEAEVYLC